MSKRSPQAQMCFDALMRMQFGEAHVFENPNDTVFTVVTAGNATEARLNHMVGVIEQYDYRVLERTVFQNTLRVDCRHAVATHDIIDRIANDGDSTIFTLSDDPATLRRVFHNRLNSHTALLLTKPGDAITIWHDVDGKGKHGTGITDFRNRSMPELNF